MNCKSLLHQAFGLWPTCTAMHLGLPAAQAYAQEVQRLDASLLAVCYVHTIQTENAEGQSACDSTFAILEVGENVAKYGDYSTYRNSTADGRNYYVPEGFRGIFDDDDPRADEYLYVYQNWPEAGKTTTREYLFPKWYVYEEEGFPAWQVTEETDSVMGHCCRKLRAEYHGRGWTAWYTEDIPAPYGPWKLAGAPGLILKASSDDGVHTFTGYSLFQVKAEQPIILVRDKENDQAIGSDKFITRRNHLKTDAQWIASPYYYANDAIKAVRVMKNNKANQPRIYINDIYFAEKRNKFQPLELK